MGGGGFKQREGVGQGGGGGTHIQCTLPSRKAEQLHCHLQFGIYF